MAAAIVEHGAPRQLISDNGVQFISRNGHKPAHSPTMCPASSPKDVDEEQQDKTNAPLLHGGPQYG
jgi:hypothetical protein